MNVLKQKYIHYIVGQVVQAPLYHYRYEKIKMERVILLGESEGNMEIEKVTCSICGKKVAGKVSKGGTGLLHVPRKHHIREVLSAGGITIVTKDEICAGSYRICKEDIERITT